MDILKHNSDHAAKHFLDTMYSLGIYPLMLRDGNVSMGATFAHSAKSVKLGVRVLCTLLFDTINGSTLGNE